MRRHTHTHTKLISTLSKFTQRRQSLTLLLLDKGTNMTVEAFDSGLAMRRERERRREWQVSVILAYASYRAQSNKRTTQDIPNHPIPAPIPRTQAHASTGEQH